MWFWPAVVCVAFFALIAVVSMTGVERDAQRQKYEIECLKSDGKIEMILGNGATCVHK